MAVTKKVMVSVTDDIDGTSGADTVSFSFEGKGYQIDLCPKNRDRLAQALDEFIAHARPVRFGTSDTGRNVTVPLRGRQSRPEAVSSMNIREWAKSQGFEVSERGRLPMSVIHAYHAANPTVSAFPEVEGPPQELAS